MEEEKKSAYSKYKDRYRSPREITLWEGGELRIQPNFLQTHLDVFFNGEKLGSIRIGFLLQKRFQREIDGRSLLIQSAIDRKKTNPGRSVNVKVILDGEQIFEFFEYWAKS